MAHGRNSSIASIRINDQLLAAVKSLAASQGMSTNQLIIQLVQHGLECRERQEFLVKFAAVSFPVTDAVSLPVTETVVRRTVPVTHVSQAYPIKSMEVRHGKHEG